MSLHDDGAGEFAARHAGGVADAACRDVDLGEAVALDVDVRRLVIVRPNDDRQPVLVKHNDHVFKMN